MTFARLPWKTLFLLILAVALSVVLAACAGSAPETTAPEATSLPATDVPATEEAPAAEEMPPAKDVALTIFAAASLTDVFTEMGSAFEATHPGLTVAYNFAGSNQLSAQIGEGAPADVFASANAAQMDVAVESGRVDADAAQLFVTNRLIVVFPADNPAGIVELQDLANPDTLIVLAAEEVPVGRYSLEFLDLAVADPAFGATFKEDVLGNVVSYEENVRAVLNKVELGEADAGIVYTSDLFGVENVGQLEIPDALNILAKYPIAPLNDSAYGEMAAAFVDYILSEEGQATLVEYGFGPAPTP
ncbi:Molybdenum ABC transporter, periplasmic molybdate-binding protein [Candidatus Promineifilum breve]|uniref:Molybdenum ABC transporter, periplasmic molybdate-binding protein n=1 Tax=Candidatus Promineifilum breve TaxID=1806508 RepID=A0A170PF90_9CHLR|nr:molybdate ABC transporter substrate-binding protein [Candidatus Promineifilum breve]CUS03053.2 Molybdenum ABC transporter, periplasmic molybdate-binding protein [Candidatus Promineifilum breve]